MLDPPMPDFRIDVDAEADDFDVVVEGRRDDKILRIDLVLEGLAALLAEHMRELGMRTEDLIPIVHVCVVGAGFDVERGVVEQAIARFEREAVYDRKRKNGWITFHGGDVVAARKIVQATVPENHSRDPSTMADALAACGANACDEALTARTLRCAVLGDVLRAFEAVDPSVPWRTRPLAELVGADYTAREMAPSRRLLVCQLYDRFVFEVANRDAQTGDVTMRDPLAIDDATLANVRQWARRDRRLARLREAVSADLFQHGVHLRRLQLMPNRTLLVRASRRSGIAEADAVGLIRAALQAALDRLQSARQR